VAKSRAFVDTTILANVLLKTGPLHEAAEKALRRYDRTSLPVYAIKEWKRGQLAVYVLYHNHLKRTRSWSQTHQILAKWFKTPRRQGTLPEADAAAVLRIRPNILIKDWDVQLAEHYRLALKTLIYESWNQRRDVTTETILNLDCYVEAPPRDRRNGEIDLAPQDCKGGGECCLADRLRARRELLIKLRDSISGGSRENSRREEALSRIISHHNLPFDRKQCRALGDAYFVIFAPGDSVILTTNLKDHQPLAAAIGKTAVGP
jgi:predicted nucleic acid-binding protein